MTYQSGVVSTHFNYSCGMLTSVIRGGYISGNSTKQEQTYSMGYDGFGNMTSISVGDRTLASYSYGNRNGNLASMTYGNGAEVRYEYDNLDRVTAEYWNDTLKYQYFYNAEGALVKKLDVGTGKAVNYEYDSLGRLIHSQQLENGTVIQRTEHIYDTENRIASQSWQMGDSTYSQTYTYRESDGALTYIQMSPGCGYGAGIRFPQSQIVQPEYTSISGRIIPTGILSCKPNQHPGGGPGLVKRPAGTAFRNFP